jgi:general secretion pathway protein H
VTSGALRRAGTAAMKCSRGFTLLEVIVTLLVLVLASALALPAVGRGTEGVRARSDASRFSALLRHTREQAITARKPQEVVVDPETRRITVKAGRDEPRIALTLPERVKIEANPPPALTVRFEPYGGSSGGDFLLTSYVFRYHVTVDAVTGRVRTERAQ